MCVKCELNDPGTIKELNDPGLILDCERTQNENDSIIRWGGHLYNVW